MAFALHSMAVDYEPSGQVDTVNIFHAIKMMAASQEEWVSEHLSRWSDFSKTEPRFHHVDGAHYTIIRPDHVSDYSQKLMTALKSRGL